MFLINKKYAWQVSCKNTTHLTPARARLMISATQRQKRAIELSSSVPKPPRFLR